MKSMVRELEGGFADALAAVLGEEGRGVDPLIRPSADERFGDYQSNVAMSLAKRVGAKPRDLADRIIAHLPAQTAAMCEPFEMAGPGFINIRLKTAWLAAHLDAVPAMTEVEAEDRLGVEWVEPPRSVVVDYSGPNIAKQMHVGHLRSTIIGDTIARVLAFEGHRVIRQNHIGDWGTQFGMLCAHLKEKMPAAMENPSEVHLADLEAFYREATARDKDDAAFHERARAEVVALHRQEESTLKAWRYIVEESRRHYLPIYRRLGVQLQKEDERGESFYADRLAGLVAELQRKFPPGEPRMKSGDANEGPRITVAESEGALVVFHHAPSGEPIFKNPEGGPFPLIIRKSDGAFLYATTDLAALRFRVSELGADRIIYVTDARQAQHFEMVFTTARATGWTDRPAGRVDLDHVTFGSILGEDRKPLKTRSGENIKLVDLLDEAVSRAEALIRTTEADAEKRRGFGEDEIRDVADAVGIGAVKYADLSQNRQSDYVFSWDKMLAMEGNTAPYLMYAYARIRSIYRKGAEQGGGGTTGGHVCLEAAEERLLARQILRFAEAIDSVAAGLKINLLTDYLYDLAGRFMKFYECCPVLKAESDELKASRLRLCDLTARTLRVGLGLLGIRVVERM